MFFFGSVELLDNTILESICADKVSALTTRSYLYRNRLDHLAHHFHYFTILLCNMNDRIIQVHCLQFNCYCSKQQSISSLFTSIF